MRCYHNNVFWSFTQRIYNLKVNNTATLESERASERERENILNLSQFSFLFL